MSNVNKFIKEQKDFNKKLIKGWIFLKKMLKKLNFFQLLKKS